MRSFAWDIFCKVVDNYGDAGVCWRLARQLADDWGQRVRLWVDDNDTLARLYPPALLSGPEALHCGGVEVRRWNDPFPMVEPHDIVISTFGCDLPEIFLSAMQDRSLPLTWINLEYLSAEHWIESCHRLPSPHPRLSLTQYFYFPGFNSRTGGVAIEKNFIAQRDAFQTTSSAINAFWRELGLPPSKPNELRISLFCYPNAPIERLIHAWSRSAHPITCVVPEANPELRTVGNLKVHPIQFLPQADYDRLLWSCDLNFVRGEDSFVRGQLAAIPLVWQIYPRDDRAHMIKLRAFLDLYCARLSLEAAAALRNFWEAWNGAEALSPDLWQRLHHHLGILKTHGRQWTVRLAQLNNLAAGLVGFCEERLQYASFQTSLPKQAQP